MIISSNQNILCRAYKPSDADAFLHAAQESVDTVGKWLPWCHPGYSAEEAALWIDTCQINIDKGDAYDVGIFSQKNDTLIGGIAINSIDKLNRIGNVGYWVRPSMEKRGYALQAVELMAVYGFEVLNLVRLEIVAHVDNKASRRVAEKTGATLECIAENRLMHEGKPGKAAIYVLLANNTEQG